ncbi:hypothetical protein [Methylobacterium sp. ID0610]|uniref:hypothetical protein n=1 Tax=Methylobacterium carpenticola TaxID=3344827 RepID=UPI0036C2EF7F
MPTDPIHARTLAGACATGGLATMMLAPAPAWSNVAVGVAALVAFGLLSLLAGRRAGPGTPGPRRITVEVVVEDWPPVPRPVPPPPPPPVPPPLPPRPFAGAHPAIYRAMRVRRLGR